MQTDVESVARGLTKAQLVALFFMGALSGTAVLSAMIVGLCGVMHLAATAAFYPDYVPPFPWPVVRFFSVIGAFVSLIVSGLAVRAHLKGNPNGN
jgi:hypothetical protein